MSGMGAGSFASSVDLSQRDFLAMYFMATARVLSKFKTLFWRSVSAQSHCFQVVQKITCLVREQWKTMTVVVEQQLPLP